MSPPFFPSEREPFSRSRPRAEGASSLRSRAHKRQRAARRGKKAPPCSFLRDLRFRRLQATPGLTSPPASRPPPPRRSVAGKRHFLFGSSFIDGVASGSSFRRRAPRPFLSSRGLFSSGNFIGVIHLPNESFSTLSSIVVDFLILLVLFPPVYPFPSSSSSFSPSF